MGFLPGILMNFLARTMFVEQEYRKLLYVTIVRFLVEVLIMTIFIKYTIYSIPIALVASKFIVSILLFRLLNKKNPGIFNKNHFVLIYLGIILISFLIICINNYFLPHLLAMSKDSLLLIYLPMMGLYLSLIHF